MIASLLSPTSSNPPGPGRISQLLPSVKCSTCHQPVPLAELGDHTCAPPPPVPQLPKPSMTPEAATALLPGRLQGRVASPVTPVPAASSSRLGSSPPGVQEPPQHQRLPSSSNARLKINTRGGTSPTQATFQPKSSPLARSDSDTNSLYAREPPFPINPSSSPLRTRMRTPSNAGTISNQSTPSTARPSISFNHSGQETTPTGPGPLRNGPAFPTAPTRGSQPPAPRQAVQPPRIGSPAMNGFPPPNRGIPPAGYNNGAPPGGTGGPPMGFSSRPGPPPLGAGPQNNLNLNGGPRNMGPPPPDNVVNANTAPTHADQVFVPPAERGIDTKTGGAAGMAGVGRRGFAAAARAAMFVGPGNRPLGPQTQYGRRPNAPQYLDIDAATRCECLFRVLLVWQRQRRVTYVDY
ncbi:hypothetical protein BDZ97DRAFT_1794692 [Flammula alnicola]|nr:hypothetical protein BDZ97DRAFT_1794692 [Flammula alnicola]